jgi:hypothetical protein
VVLLVSLLVVYAMQHAIGMIPASIKTEKQGNFKIRAARYEGFGHSYTREDLYYRGELIARGIGQVQLDPGDGDRMLFSLPFPGKLAAGTYYYDGRRKQLFRIDSGLLFYTKEKGNERCRRESLIWWRTSSRNIRPAKVSTARGLIWCWWSWRQEKRWM